MLIQNTVLLRSKSALPTPDVNRHIWRPGCLNVATGSFSRSCFFVERSNKLRCLHHTFISFGDSKDFVATKVASGHILVVQLGSEIKMFVNYHITISSIIIIIIIYNISNTSLRIDDNLKYGIIISYCCKNVYYYNLK